MHFKIITKVYSQAENQIDLEMQKKRKDIRKSLGMLKAIGNFLLDETVIDAELRKTVFSQIDKED